MQLNYIKQFSILFSCFFFADILFAETPPITNNPLKICMQLTWDAGVRFGAEYEISPCFALKSDIGTTLFSFEGNLVITYDIFGVWELLKKNSPFQINLLFGLPYNMYVFGVNSEMYSFGCSLEFGYRFNKKYALYFRGGGGYPVYYNSGKWSSGILWPDAALELKISI